MELKQQAYPDKNEYFPKGSTILVVGPTAQQFAASLRMILGQHDTWMVRWTDAKGRERVEGVRAAEPGVTVIAAASQFPVVRRANAFAYDDSRSLFPTILRTTGSYVAKLVRLHGHTVEQSALVHLMKDRFVVTVAQ